MAASGLNSGDLTPTGSTFIAETSLKGLRHWFK